VLALSTLKINRQVFNNNRALELALVSKHEPNLSIVVGFDEPYFRMVRYVLFHLMPNEIKYALQYVCDRIYYCIYKIYVKSKM
jgi:hypothetical protein